MFDRTFSQNPFLEFESPSRSNEGLRSAILNCICPKCGAGLSLAADQLRCQEVVRIVGGCGLALADPTVHNPRSG